MIEGHSLIWVTCKNNYEIFLDLLISYYIHASLDPLYYPYLAHSSHATMIIGPQHRKPVFWGLRITKAQTSLRIRTVWSAPLFSFFAKYHIQTCYKRNFHFLASLCSWAAWFVSHFVGNPGDRFSRDDAYIMHGQ